VATSTKALVEQVKVQDAILTKAAERSFRAYVEQAWPILEPETPLLPNWHIDLLAEYLEAVTAGEIRQLLITVPPRSMKSILVSVLWPTWEWIRCPNRRWICASYAEALATKQSLDRRTILQSDWYQARWADRVRLASDQNVKGEFQNTKRGVMIATSIGGSITGKGGDRIIVDDLINPQQAESDAHRETALAYFRKTLATRLDHKKTGAIVVVMQRLHERDLAVLCQELGYTHVCLPAEAEGHSEIVFPRSHRIHVRESGDLLWPAREGRAELDALKRQLGSAAYSAQYQQRPVPAGGIVFKRDWFKFYDERPKLDSLQQSWDMTFKAGPSNDYVVGLQAGRCGADLYLLDCVRGQWDFRETLAQMRSLYGDYPATGTILVEESANGPAIIAMLGREIPGIVGVQPEGGKYPRAMAAQPVLEAGNVWLPNPRPHGRLLPERAWVEPFIDECCAFPNGRHDDQVDAFSQLVVRHTKPVYVTGLIW